MSDLNSLNKETNYKVGYYFSMNNNSFSIDFFSESGERFDSIVQRHLIDSFRLLNKHQDNLHTFEMVCPACHRYNAISNYFSLNFRTCEFNLLVVEAESFLFALPQDDGYKIILMDNTYPELYRKSLVYIWHDEADEGYGVNSLLPYGFYEQKLPLIPFVSKEETAIRLTTLLTFV